jgi:hypothetical protein
MLKNRGRVDHGTIDIHHGCLLSLAVTSYQLSTSGRKQILYQAGLNDGKSP